MDVAAWGRHQHRSCLRATTDIVRSEETFGSSEKRLNACRHSSKLKSHAEREIRDNLTGCKRFKQP